MSKFSDFPYFILKDFHDPLITTYEGTFNSYLRGGESMMLAEGSWIYLYTLDNEGRYVGHRFKILSRDGNDFKFQYIELISTFTGATSSFDTGSEIYVRKDSYLHSFIDYDTDYDGYVNTNKDFLYFGEIHNDPDGYWNVIFRGMKDYVMDALPAHNRTDNLTEFVNVYFDQVHQQIYNLQKTLWTLHDPKEVNISFLGYLADTYGITIDDDFIDYMGELPAREWVDAMISFLKRKGTYSAIYAIWKTLLAGTSNKLRVYEMWHNKNLTGIPKDHFYEISYEEYYNIAPSGCVESDYYDTVAPSGYPDWEGDGYTHTVTTSATPSNLVLTPHYKVEIDLTCEPLGSDYIINESTIDNLVSSWNYTKPVSKFAHYSEFISPISDFSESYVSLYGIDYEAFLNSMFTGSAFASAGGLQTIPGAYEQKTASAIWNVTHNLDSEEAVVQCYDFDDKMIMPKAQVITSADVITVEFDEAVRGESFVGSATSSGYTHNQSVSAATWNINHGLNKKEQLVQFYNPNNERMIPANVELVDNNNIIASWATSASGKAVVRIPDIVITDYVGSPSTTWIMDHNSNAAGLVAQFFDTDDYQMYPDSLTLVDDNQCIAIFSEPTSGYAAVHYIPKEWSQDAIMTNIDNWKIGTGGSASYNPITYNNIDTIAVSGSDFLRQYNDDNYYYIDFEVPNGIGDMNITEIGIFNNDRNLMFYTYESPLFKKSEAVLTIHYRISKTNI